MLREAFTISTLTNVSAFGVNLGTGNSHISRSNFERRPTL